LRTGGAALLSFAFLFAACSPGRMERHRQFEAMGWPAACRIVTEDASLADHAFDEVASVLDSVSALMDPGNPDSEISRLNRAPADSAFTLSPWTTDCLHLAVKLQRQSGGAFDVSTGLLSRLWGFYGGRAVEPSPMEIAGGRKSLGQFYLDDAWGRVTKHSAATAFDLDGIARGFALRLCEKRLREMGVDSARLDLGGDTICLGAPPHEEAWTADILDPRDRSQVFARLRLHDETMASRDLGERFVTIGGKRYGHIMNPATGRPADELLGATAVCRDAALADGLSTALFVLGPDGARELLETSFPDVDAVLVIPGEDGGKPTVWITPGLAGRFELLPEYVKRYRLPTASFQPEGAQS